MMAKLLFYVFYVSLIVIKLSSGHSKPKDDYNGVVGELNDKFLNIYKQDVGKGWLVKFYAPWCHHCRQMEPTYKEVAEEVAKLKLNVYVARIDCTRFSHVATEFAIRGFPTLMYITPNRVVEFLGDRNKEEIVDFVKRMSGPPIRSIINCQQLNQLKNEHRVFFVHFSDDQIWTNYSEAAIALQTTDWFYHSKVQCPDYEPNSVYAFKSSLNKLKASKFPVSNLNVKESNVRFIDWIKVERFPKFIRASMGNLNQLISSNKMLVVVMLENDLYSKQSRLSVKERKYFEKLEQLANEPQWEEKFLFAWTNQLDLINSIVISVVSPLPAYVLINATDLTNYIVADENAVFQIEGILHSIQNNQNDQPSFSGGKGFLIRILRMAFDTYIAILQMFRSNPILTSILFGFPIALVTFLIYCSCFTDFLEGTDDEFGDEDEEEEEEEMDDEDQDFDRREQVQPNGDHEIDQLESSQNNQTLRFRNSKKN